jgi:hypothetical protein
MAGLLFSLSRTKFSICEQNKFGSVRTAYVSLPYGERFTISKKRGKTPEIQIKAASDASRQEWVVIEEVYGMGTHKRIR